jgi:predicted nucleotidyltransferase component of viral defense system
MDDALRNIIVVRGEVLKALNKKLEGFLLAGGTALSLFYFRHRESFDLDFFTKTFSEKSIKRIMSEISKSLRVKIDQISRFIVKDKAQMIVCMVPVLKNSPLQIDDRLKSLKVDFVEDLYRDVELHTPIIDGIPVMSRENIYLRKIYAAFGVVKMEDDAGNKKFIGGRQEAKDIFDLYYLSKTFIPLSVFMERYCTLDEKVSSITWHRRYDRLAMKSELLDIITDEPINCREVEEHFNSEIESIIKQVAGEI